MAILCEKYSLLFIMAPRTGCTAVGHVLINELDGKYIPAQDLLDDKGYMIAQKKHTTIEQLLKNKVLAKEDLEKLTTFSTVRNPFDSLVSLYHKLNSGYQSELDNPNSWVYKLPYYVENLEFCRNASFEQWIDRVYPDIPASRFIYSKKAIKRLFKDRLVPESDFLKGIDYVMKFESLQEDFSKVLKKVGINDPPKIPMINKTKARSERDYRAYYSTKSRKKIESYMENIIIRYGYRF